MIRIFDQGGNKIDRAVKPILREINELYNLNVDLFFPNSKVNDKTTQILGRDIIEALNKTKIPETEKL